MDQTLCSIPELHKPGVVEHTVSLRTQTQAGGMRELLYSNLGHAYSALCISACEHVRMHTHVHVHMMNN